MSWQGPWEGERGFTLIEVLITIIVMGLLLGIASSVLFGIVEGRRVDSATNQLAADLRLAHTRATNQLEDWQVSLDGDSSTYNIGPVGTPSTRDLDDSVGDEIVVDAAALITFEPDGSAVLPGDATSATLTVRTADDEEPLEDDLIHRIEINAATSRIQIDP